MSPVPGKNDVNPGQNGAAKPPIEEPSQKRARRFPVSRILLGAGFVLGVLSLVSAVVLSRQAGEQLKDATQTMAHAREVLEKMGEISARLSEMESAARSFTISGKQSQLTPFYTAAKAVPPELEELKLLLKDDPEQLQSVTKIEPVIARHLKVMKDLVELGKPGLFRGAGQRGLTDEGTTLMEQIQAAFSTVAKDQRARVGQEQTTMAAIAARVTAISTEGSILAGVLVLAGGVVALRAWRARDKAQGNLCRLLGSMPDALIIVTAEGKIVGSNAQTEKLFGYNDQELQGESMALLVPERFRQTQRQYYASYFSQRNGRTPATTMELCALHKDGREFPVEVSTKPLAAENGLAVTSTIRDITVRKQVEQQVSKLNQELELRALELEAANQELEAFSYSVSHDLRSPLQNIDSFSQILMEDYANRGIL